MTAVLAPNARTTALRTVGTTTITGTISDPSAYPLAGITIRLYDDGPDGGSLVDTTVTDDAGCYRFTGVLTDGTDSYRFEADDLTGKHIYAGSRSFVATVGITAIQDLTMRIAGVIQGKVATAGRSIVVTAEAKHWVGESTVSPNGTFRLGGLAPGTYTVTLQDHAQTFFSEALKIKVTAGRTTTLRRPATTRRS